MASGTPGGDWRHDAGAGGSSAPRGKSRRSWHPGGAAPGAPGGRRRSKVGRVLLAGAAAGVLLALIVILIEWLKPLRYPSVVVVAPDTPGSLALPENVAPRNAEAADRDAWKKRLDPRAPAVVLYFAAHGGADPGGPFLWMGPPGPPADAHKLRVREILAELARLPKRQPKLLVFDVTHTPLSWPHGMLPNDFARALKERDAEVAGIDGLAVICASDDDQRSWVSEEWRKSEEWQKTVFGHFWSEGLKGAAGEPGDRITAKRLFDFLAREVDRWAVANRGERQTPVLLPRGDGERRAAAVELAAVPSGGYAAPPAPEPPGKVPADLEAEWGTAEQLTGRVPAPDTTDPAAWREYLELLMLWDRRVRLGGDTEAVRARVRVLAGRLMAAAEPACLPAAIPAGRAFGVVPQSALDADFRRLWDPPTGKTRADVWGELLGPKRAGETARRLAVAGAVVAQVIVDGPKPDVLKTADEVLAVVYGSRLVPAEAHFIRMLHRHLDARARPPVELLRTAIRLRAEAEETAWAGGVGPGAYPHAEQVFRWVRNDIKAGDLDRERGQDLLFAGDPKSWELAQNKYFPDARNHYRKAREVAGVIAAALATRDQVLTRLPYYARWAAGDRGRLSPGEVGKLFERVEDAMRGAHKIAELTQDVPADPAGRVGEIAVANQKAREAFAAVVGTFDNEVRGLSNVAHPSNWHALDGALAVPFIPARDRVKLLGYVRDVSYQLATKSEQRPGVDVTPSTPARELARRHLRMAVAVLGEGSDELRRLIESPKQDAWWESYREAGERVGRRFRGLSAAVADEVERARKAPDPERAARHLGEAAYLARLADPAAPVAGNDPIDAERRLGRHDFLLWHAERTVRAGWADVAGLPGGYCRMSAGLLVASAEGLARGPGQSRLPSEIDRRLEKARAAVNQTPATLRVSADETRELTDEPDWEFKYWIAPEIKPNTPRDIGFPVYWLTPHGPSHPPATRKVEHRFAGGEEKVESAAVFRAPPRTAGTTEPDVLTTTVLYRGHRYQTVTKVRPAGPPTLDLRSVPPKGPAAFAVQADKELVAGAVTVLIDLSGSMDETVPGTGLKKLQETFDALEKMLGSLPRGTTLTVAFFWGEAGVHVEPLTSLVWRGEEVQKEEVMKAVRARKPVPRASTPLAGAVRRVLSKGAAGRFWPKTASGTRTLVVLTDGVDNWDKEKAGPAVLKALVDAEEDTALHLIFFGMTDADERAAYEQYRVLENPEPYRDSGRTPTRLWRGVTDAKGLAERLRGAVVPRVSYRGNNAGREHAGRLQATLPGAPLYDPSVPLPPGWYDLFWPTPQKLGLAPGDRALLRVDRDRNPYFPLIAYETARRLNRPCWPTGDAARGGIRVTIPEATIRERVGYCDLYLVVTMERVGGVPAGSVLQTRRPLLPLFEVAYADGDPPDPGLRPTLVVANRPGLLAPAWNLTLSRWDRNDRPGTARPPAVTAHWVEDLPDPAEKFPVDLKHPDRAAGQLPGAEVEEVRVTVEDVTGPELPPGKYLTVRLKCPRPGNRVFIRPVGLKGPDQSFRLAERHLYFDAQGRYTARFGPLSPEDLEGPVTLELYRVEQLKERAMKSDRAATVRFPDRRLGPLYLPDELRLEPAKE